MRVFIDSDELYPDWNCFEVTESSGRWEKEHSIEVSRYFWEEYRRVTDAYFEMARKLAKLSEDQFSEQRVN
jgi:hypothetical protein